MIAFFPDVADSAVVQNLREEPRSMTAIEVNDVVTDMFLKQHVNTWTGILSNLDMPNYYLSFAAIVCVHLSLTLDDETADEVIFVLNDLFSFPPEEYDFSDLGEAWSRPLILRLPVGTAGAMKWTAVFGGGFNAAVSSEYGAKLFIIDLEDSGKIINKIDIADDDSSNGIQNSVPPRLMAINADSSTYFQGTTDPNGSIIYFSDLEGKLWKVNLTDQGTLYETVRLFDAESDNSNTRLMFHEHAASVDTSGNLWQYYGSGDQQSLGDIDSNIANRGYAYMHSTPVTDFTATSMHTVSDMVDISLGACPSDGQYGWYLNLDSNEKITAKASVSNGYVYFSRYTPNSGDICASGTAKISEHSYTCGTLEAEFDLGYGVPTESIIYKNKIYLGISTDQVTASLPAGWSKSGNLIIGTPSELATGKVQLESWWEEF